MYFIIDKSFKIHNVCTKSHDIYKMILDTLQNYCAVSVTQTNNFNNITTPGYYFFRQDNQVWLRKYTEYEGYVSTYLDHEELNKFEISDFSTPEINIFVEQLKCEIKRRYDKEMDDLQCVSNTPQNGKKAVKTFKQATNKDG